MPFWWKNITGPILLVMAAGLALRLFLSFLVDYSEARTVVVLLESHQKTIVQVCKELELEKIYPEIKEKRTPEVEVRFMVHPNLYFKAKKMLRDLTKKDDCLFRVVKESEGGPIQIRPKLSRTLKITKKARSLAGLWVRSETLQSEPHSEISLELFEDGSCRLYTRWPGYSSRFGSSIGGRFNVFGDQVCFWMADREGAEYSQGTILDLSPDKIRIRGESGKEYTFEHEPYEQSPTLRNSRHLRVTPAIPPPNKNRSR